MDRSKFLGTLLVVVISLNVGGWALSVGTSPQIAQSSVPVTPSGINALSISASAAASQTSSEDTSDFSSGTAATTSTNTIHKAAGNIYPVVGQ